MLAAILICGSGVMTSCSKDDNTNQPQKQSRERVIAFEGIENGRDMGSLVM